jgi:hypothetical protein
MTAFVVDNIRQSTRRNPARHDHSERRVKEEHLAEASCE